MALQKRQLWFLLPLLAFLLAIGLFYSRLGKDTTVVTNTSLNRQLPAFTLPMLGQPDKEVTEKDLPTSPYILNVWGSWCITCKIEHPFLLKMAEAGVPIVGVNYKDEPQDALRYLNDNRDPFALNVQDHDGSYGIELGLTGAPESFVIDGKGEVRQHIIGEINEERYNKQVLPCMTALRNNANDSQIKEVCQ